MAKYIDRLVFNVLVATPPCTHHGRLGQTEEIARRAGIPIASALAVLSELLDHGMVLSITPPGAPRAYRWARTAAAEDLLHPPGLEAIRGS